MFAHSFVFSSRNKIFQHVLLLLFLFALEGLFDPCHQKGKLIIAKSYADRIDPPLHFITLWSVYLFKNLFRHDKICKTLSGRSHELPASKGVGKTQIAIEYAYGFHQEHQAVLWEREREG